MLCRGRGGGGSEKAIQLSKGQGIVEVWKEG